jgi:hypothetical protein
MPMLLLLMPPWIVPFPPAVIRSDNKKAEHKSDPNFKLLKMTDESSVDSKIGSVKIQSAV